MLAACQRSAFERPLQLFIVILALNYPSTACRRVILKQTVIPSVPIWGTLWNSIGAVRDRKPLPTLQYALRRSKASIPPQSCLKETQLSMLSDLLNKRAREGLCSGFTRKVRVPLGVSSETVFVTYAGCGLDASQVY